MGARGGFAALTGRALSPFVGFVLLQGIADGERANFEGLRRPTTRARRSGSRGRRPPSATRCSSARCSISSGQPGPQRRVSGQFLGLVFLGPLLLGSPVCCWRRRTSRRPTPPRRQGRLTLSPKEARPTAARKAPTAGRRLLSQKRQEDGPPCDRGLIGVTRPVMGFAGGLSLVVALLHLSLEPMRTGLLGRFWGSLGMAVGVAALLGLRPSPCSGSSTWDCCSSAASRAGARRPGSGRSDPLADRGEKAARAEDAARRVGGRRRPSARAETRRDPSEGRRKRKQRD